ncbi:MAG: hypothetical protein NPIRA03_32200 [Nitrospirales bacterium]|nr:MAG: hypothetical protein NPIRA03_32200 [Nitrospirales bacterium]
MPDPAVRAEDNEFCLTGDFREDVHLPNAHDLQRQDSNHSADGKYHSKAPAWWPQWSGEGKHPN